MAFLAPPRAPVSLPSSALPHAKPCQSKQVKFPRSAKPVRCLAGGEQPSSGNGSLTGRSGNVGNPNLAGTDSSTSGPSNGASSASSSKPAAAPSAGAAAALRALDAQLLELAREERQKRGIGMGSGGSDGARREGAAGPAISGPSSSNEKPAPSPQILLPPAPPHRTPPSPFCLLPHPTSPPLNSSPRAALQVGRMASAEGWPEFDTPFLAYSGGALLLFTLLSNLVFAWGSKTFAPPAALLDSSSPSEAATAAQPRSQMARLIQEKLRRGAELNGYVRVVEAPPLLEE
ncbi:unnamed protein product [Closterium sp. Naga37s-1]|nr:unnamed protein product [Closterium sp. Naga37s-1]